jgi:hypothetical protein
LLGASVTYNGLDVTALVPPFITQVTINSARVVIPNLVFPPGTNATVALTIATTQGGAGATTVIQVQ